MRRTTAADDDGGSGGGSGKGGGVRMEKGPKWTAMDVMTAYADRKGWVTAKAGRPDVNRAGNASEWALSFSFYSYHVKETRRSSKFAVYYS